MSRERLEPAPVSPLEKQLRMAGASSSQAKPNIQPIGASPLLSQLKQFLPKMQQANAELQQKLQECDPAELDIEHVPQQEGEEDAGPVIQMDLACGLLELRDDAAVATAQRSIAAGGDIAVEAYDGGSSSDSDSEDSSSDAGSERDEPMLDGFAADAGEAGEAGAARGASADGKAAAATAQQGRSADATTAGSAAAATASEQSPEQQQQQHQQQQGKQRRKLKPKRPMIVEL